MVRLSRDPKAVAVRMSNVNKQLAVIDRRQQALDKQRSVVVEEKEGLMSAIQARLAGAALDYLTSDPKRLDSFRKTLDARQSGLLDVHLEGKGAAKPAASAKPAPRASKAKPNPAAKRAKKRAATKAGTGKASPVKAAPAKRAVKKKARKKSTPDPAAAES